jgi:hypothetical protein
MVWPILLICGTGRISGTTEPAESAIDHGSSQDKAAEALRARATDETSITNR